MTDPVSLQILYTNQTTYQMLFLPSHSNVTQVKRTISQPSWVKLTFHPLLKLLKMETSQTLSWHYVMNTFRIFYTINKYTETDWRLCTNPQTWALSYFFK